MKKNAFIFCVFAFISLCAQSETTTVTQEKESSVNNGFYWYNSSSGWGLRDVVRYDFIEDGWGASINFGANKAIGTSSYLSFGVGYRGFFYDPEGISSNFDFIEIPFELGYAIAPSIVPYIGLNMNIGISGNTWIAGLGDYKADIGGDLFYDAILGLRFRFGDMNLGVGLVFPINEDKSIYGDTAALSLSYSWGF